MLLLFVSLFAYACHRLSYSHSKCFVARALLAVCLYVCVSLCVFHSVYVPVFVSVCVFMFAAAYALQL